MVPEDGCQYLWQTNTMQVREVSKRVSSEAKDEEVKIPGSCQ